MLLYIIVFIIGSSFFLFKYKMRLQNQNYQERFGSLYLNLKNKEKYSFLITTFFLLRRFLFAISINFFELMPIMQVGMNIFISLWMVIFIA